MTTIGRMKETYFTTRNFNDGLRNLEEDLPRELRDKATTERISAAARANPRWPPPILGSKRPSGGSVNF
jgi:hypothetical protein